MRNNQLNNKIPLIIGSSGKTGRRVINRLNEHGLEYREGSRNSVIPFDWYDNSTWNKSLQGISSVYLVFSPDLAVPGAPEIIKNFVQIAKSCDVEHLVLLSGRGEVDAQNCERIVMNSTLDWTIVRSSWFAQNFSESFFLEDIIRGQVFLPVGNIKEPFVDIEDLADVVFAALTDDKHRNQVYEITGSELLTFREVISDIASTTNRSIEFQQISMDDYEKYMIETEVPEDYVALIKYLFTEVLDGRNELITDGVKRALGRDPRRFHSYVNMTTETGVWNSVEKVHASA